MVLILYLQLLVWQMSASTWFKAPLETTKSGLGAEQLIGVIKYQEGTRTVYSLTSPNHFSSTKLTKFAAKSLLATLPRADAPQVAVHRGFVDSGRSEVLKTGVRSNDRI